MAKFMKESGRLRYQEKSFNVEMGNALEASDCAHGWYRKNRKHVEVCVKCDTPKDQCEAQLAAREAPPLDDLHETISNED